MELVCKCLHYEDHEPPVEIPTTVSHIYGFDFGNVVVFGEKSMYLTIKACKKSVDTTFQVRKDPNINPIYETFTFNRYEGKLHKRQFAKLKITYKPILAHQENFQRFDVTDSCGNIFVIKCNGRSLGPRVTCSVRYLHFYKAPRFKQFKQRFEIQNRSEVPTLFKFDMDVKNNDVFQIEPTSGCIKEMSRVCITVTFHPYELGVFSYQLACLIWRQEPILVNLYGAYTDNWKVHPNYTIFQNYPLPFEKTVGFSGYFQDAVESKKYTPPVTMDNNFLDFGSILQRQTSWESPETDLKYLSLTRMTSLSNHMRCDIEVRWPVDPDGIFIIKPRITKISASETKLFEIYFCPKVENNLYSKVITAQIIWTADDVANVAENIIYVPLNATIYVIGHSFPKSESWLSKIIMDPPTVTLHACLPGNSGFSTFKVQNEGHLPVMYKLIPPKQTNFVLKPMVGLIRQFQLICVMLLPGMPEKKIHMEQWNMVLNGHLDRNVSVWIKVEVSTPQICVGENNYVSFGTVHPDTQEMREVAVKNISSFHLNFEFMINKEHENFFSIVPKKGQLFSNDEMNINMAYTGTICAPRNWVNVCKLQTTQRIRELVGKPFDSYFKVFAVCSYSKLCAQPNTHDLGNLKWGAFIRFEFVLHNFGEAKLHYKLLMTCVDKNTDTFLISPENGVVLAKNKKKVTIEGNINCVGEHSFTISYVPRICDASNEIAKNSEPIELLTFTYNCSYPTFKIEEVIDNNYGNLFSKIDLWNFLDIPKFNNILETIAYGETKEMHMYLPDGRVNLFDQFYVTLLLKNVTKFDGKIELERIVTCSCKIKEISISLTKRKKVLECPHRDMLEIESTVKNFTADERFFLVFQAKYLLENETVVSYLMKLSNNRAIIIQCHINAFPNHVHALSPYSRAMELKFSPVFIGQYKAPFQVMWFYNNTANTVEYTLHEDKIYEYNEEMGFGVIFCANPKGIVRPFSDKGLLLRFHPVEGKLYSVVTYFEVGGVKREFLIEGLASLQKGFKIKPIMEASNDDISTNRFPLTISAHHMNIDAFPVWNCTERLFFITNVSDDKVFKYKWKEANLEDLLQIRAIHKTDFGFLGPKESHSIVVRIKSLGEPLKTRITFHCDCVDYTEQLRYERSLQAYNARQDQINSEFSVTAKGFQSIVNEIYVPPAPVPFGIALDFSVYIVDYKDMDTYINVDAQFRQTPPADFKINGDNIAKSFKKRLFKKQEPVEVFQNDEKPPEKKEEECKMDKYISFVVRITLERFLGDFTKSKYFGEVLRYSNVANINCYQQFMISKDEIYKKTNLRRPLTAEDVMNHRCDEVRTLFQRPSILEMSTVFKKLIFDACHDFFDIKCSNRSANQADRLIEGKIHICSKSCTCKKKKKKYEIL